jgi:ribosomal protein L11 methyltransferase
MVVRYVLPAAEEPARSVLVAALWNAGAVGVWERADDLVAWFAEPTSGVPPGGVWQSEEDRDWLEEWKAGLEPVQVGAFTVVPSWHEDAARPDVLLIDPAMAFGTGHHPTTRLCLSLLQTLPLEGASVLDVGSGTGILAVAAARLGADRVVAVDLDLDAVRATDDNARRNSVRVDARHGGLEAAEPDGPFDVVVANLTTATVCELAARLVAVTSRTLITGGISTDRLASAEGCLASGGAAVLHTVQEEAWAAMLAQPASQRG